MRDRLREPQPPGLDRKFPGGEDELLADGGGLGRGRFDHFVNGIKPPPKGKNALNQNAVNLPMNWLDWPRPLECGGKTPLLDEATCRLVQKRGHVRALQIKGSTHNMVRFIG
jgi:hypothetical protein